MRRAAREKARDGARKRAEGGARARSAQGGATAATAVPLTTRSRPGRQASHRDISEASPGDLTAAGMAAAAEGSSGDPGSAGASAEGPPGHVIPAGAPDYLRAATVSSAGGSSGEFISAGAAVAGSPSDVRAAAGAPAESTHKPGPPLSPSQHTYSMCGAPARPGGAKLRACGRCMSVLYCSPECQSQHWAAEGGHKGACPQLRESRAGRKAAMLELGVQEPPGDEVDP